MLGQWIKEGEAMVLVGSCHSCGYVHLKRTLLEETPEHVCEAKGRSDDVS